MIDLPGIWAQSAGPSWLHIVLAQADLGPMAHRHFGSQGLYKSYPSSSRLRSATLCLDEGEMAVDLEFA